MDELPGLGVGETGPKRPSTLPILIGSAIAALSLIFAVWWIVSGLVALSNKVDDFDRIDVPGSGVVSLDKGSYTIYYEGQRADLQVAVTDKQQPNRAVKLRRSDVSSEYSFGGHSGVSVFGFDAPVSGDYSVVVVSDTSGGQLAIGQGIGMDLVSILAVVLGVFFLGVGFGLFLFVFTVFRRRTTA